MFLTEVKLQSRLVLTKMYQRTNSTAQFPQVRWQQVEVVHTQVVGRDVVGLPVVTKLSDQFVHMVTMLVIDVFRHLVQVHQSDMTATGYIAGEAAALVFQCHMSLEIFKPSKIVKVLTVIVKMRKL